jgi:hypothetical protein
VFADQVLDEDLRIGAAVLGWMRVDHGMIKEIAPLVKHGNLAAGPEAGIDRHHDLIGNRGLQQEAAQVAGEDLHGMFFGGFRQVAANLALHAGKDETIEGIDRGRPE